MKLLILVAVWSLFAVLVYVGRLFAVMGARLGGLLYVRLVGAWLYRRRSAAILRQVQLGAGQALSSRPAGYKRASVLVPVRRSAGASRSAGNRSADTVVGSVRLGRVGSDNAE